jgi:hypothetical protein
MTDSKSAFPLVSSTRVFCSLAHFLRFNPSLWSVATVRGPLPVFLAFCSVLLRIVLRFERPRSCPSLLSLTMVLRPYPSLSSLYSSSLQSLAIVPEYQRLLTWLALAPGIFLHLDPLQKSFAKVLVLKC